MDIQGGEVTTLTQLTPSEEVYGWHEPVVRISYQKRESSTGPVHDLSVGTHFLTSETVEQVPVRLEGVYRETIREWWYGQVVRIHPEKGYFEANLRDQKGIEMVAEFDIDPGYKDLVFCGAQFVFYVTTKHGRGSPQTISQLEFTTPHIWRKQDAEYAKEIYKELFPDDAPL